MPKIICLLIVLFVCVSGYFQAGNIQVFAQQKKTATTKKTGASSVAKRKIRKKRKPTPTVVHDSLPYGVSQPDLSPSDGSGVGRGTGSGAGVGTGQGSGTGSGTRAGYGSDEPPVKVTNPSVKCENGGETTSLKIIAKPKQSYTDAARKNQVSGNVRLKVTFGANGQIGTITPISGLPYGLTEQAIAAARQIRFEPAKKCGVPISVTKMVEYNFQMY